MKTSREVYTPLIGACMVIFLLSCGGGGGGDGGSNIPTSLPSASQATITSDNAQELSAGVFESASLGLTTTTPLASLQGPPADDRAIGFRAIMIPVVLKNALDAAMDDPSLPAHTGHAMLNETGDIQGACGGQAEYSIAVNEAAGTATINFVFYDYCAAGITISGDTDVFVVIDTARDAILEATFVFYNLTSGSISIDGEIFMNVDVSPYIVEMDFSSTDRVSGKTYDVDYQLLIAEQNDRLEIDLSGKFTTSEHGYVRITTLENFVFYEDGDYPYQGSFMLHGKNNTSAVFTVINSQFCECRADTTGDGSYDWTSGAMTWERFFAGAANGTALPVSGRWRGPSDFGEIEFVVSPDGNGIQSLTLYFSDYACGIVTSNGTLKVSYPQAPLTIENGRFLVDLSSGADKFSINGQFDSRNAASGTFTADYHVNAAPCAGAWSASPAAATSSVEIDYAHLQYRTYETPANNRYAAWISVTEDGQPVDAAEVSGFQMTTAAGSPVDPSDSGFFRSTPYYFYNCSDRPCSEVADVVDSGYWATFDDLPAGGYDIEVEAADGGSVSSTVYYPGQLVLPFVSSASMRNQWANGDWVLNWTNPSSDVNWDAVDQLRIVVTAADGTELLYVRIDPTDETVTIPQSVVHQAEALGHGALAAWVIQTRAYDEHGMNYARGYSNPASLASSTAIDYAHLQYRNYENPTNNRYAAWISVTKDGEPVDATDVLGFQVKDSAGLPVDPSDSGFFRSSPYYFYNCSDNPCSEVAGVVDSGYWVNFDDLPAGSYVVEVEAADGKTVTRTVVYPGQLVLPGIAIATMQSQWSNGDLVLSWTNPTGEANWEDVDQLRIVLTATDGAEVLYIRLDPMDEDVRVPESLVTKIEQLGHGTMDLWEIQTRAYDENGMNFARGYSH